MEDTTKKKIGIISLVVIGVAILGYSQYASASHISVNMVQNELLATDEDGVSDHYIALEFNNPSLLVLTAGQTEFTIESEGESIGEGVLDAFTLTPLSKAHVSGIYYSENGDADVDSNADEVPTIRIAGQTEYDIWFASINIPFEYYPTDEQVVCCIIRQPSGHNTVVE